MRNVDAWRIVAWQFEENKTAKKTISKYKQESLTLLSVGRIPLETDCKLLCRGYFNMETSNKHSFIIFCAMFICILLSDVFITNH